MLARELQAHNKQLETHLPVLLTAASIVALWYERQARYCDRFRELHPARR